MQRRWRVSGSIPFTIVMVFLNVASAQGFGSLGFVKASPESAAAAARPRLPAAVEVCTRPLPKWAGTGNWFLRAMNLLMVRHLHHSYIHFAGEAMIPSMGASVRTMGIHPIGPANSNKQPLPDQVTDAAYTGAECKMVKDATPEKVGRLVGEIAAGICYSCGKNYHNHVLSGCYNNSNTYVYDLISGAGMTPPRLQGAPGYRPHHSCSWW